MVQFHTILYNVYFIIPAQVFWLGHNFFWIKYFCQITNSTQWILIFSWCIIVLTFTMVILDWDLIVLFATIWSNKPGCINRSQYFTFIMWVLFLINIHSTIYLIYPKHFNVIVLIWDYTIIILLEYLHVKYIYLFIIYFYDTTFASITIHCTHNL